MPSVANQQEDSDVLRTIPGGFDVTVFSSKLSAAQLNLLHHFFMDRVPDGVFQRDNGSAFAMVDLAALGINPGWSYVYKTLGDYQQWSSKESEPEDTMIALLLHPEGTEDVGLDAVVHSADSWGFTVVLELVEMLRANSEFA